MALQPALTPAYGSLWKLLTAAYNSSGDSARVRIDASTSSLQVIDYEHHEIHSGSTFEYSEALDRTVDHVYDIVLATPNTAEWSHLTFTVDVENETEVWLYEDPNVVTPGTAVTELNANRNSAHTNTTAITVITNTTLANAEADNETAS